jgi:hypothetical protein
MTSLKQLEDQTRALLADQKNLVDDKRPWSAKSAEYDNRQKDIDALLQQHAAMKSVGNVPFDMGNSLGHNSAGGRLTGMAAGIAAKGHKPIPAPQLDLDDDQLRGLYDAAKSPEPPRGGQGRRHHHEHHPGRDLRLPPAPGHGAPRADPRAVAAADVLHERLDGRVVHDHRHDGRRCGRRGRRQAAEPHRLHGADHQRDEDRPLRRGH